MVEFVAALRKLAIHCEFEAFLRQALRDRFVCGLKNEEIQQRLLAEPDLTIEKAQELAQGMEAAQSNTKEIKGPFSLDR